MIDIVSNPSQWLKEVIVFIIPILIGGFVGSLFDDGWIYVGAGVGLLFWVIIRIII